MTASHSDGTEQPLTVEVMQALVGEMLPTLMRRMGIPHWSVMVVYGPCAREEWSAQCERRDEYEAATITLDPQHHFTEKDVRRSLEHELLHVKLAPFDVYREVMAAGLKPGSPAAAQEARLWEYAIERTVKEMQRLLRGMNDTDE